MYKIVPSMWAGPSGQRGGRTADVGHKEKSGQGLDALADWGSVLSLGEQQRLAFARRGNH